MSPAERGRSWQERMQLWRLWHTTRNRRLALTGAVVLTALAVYQVTTLALGWRVPVPWVGWVLAAVWIGGAVAHWTTLIYLRRIDRDR